MKTLSAADLNDKSLVDQAWSLLLKWLLEAGAPACLEGRYDDHNDILWTRRSRNQMDTQQMPGRVFRPLMARLAVLVEAPDPYGSVATFAWESSNGTYYCRVFFCNEPTMDFWLRLYLYGGSQDWEDSQSGAPVVEES